MKNVERLARYIAKNGPDGTLVHTIPETNNWIVCQKVEDNKWMLTLCNPMGNVTYNLGTVTDGQHLQLWRELILMEVETKSTQILMAKEIRQLIHRFIKNYEEKQKEIFKKFIKKEENNQEKPSPKTKQQRSKLRKKSKRPKKSSK